MHRYLSHSNIFERILYSWFTLFPLFLEDKKLQKLFLISIISPISNSEIPNFYYEYFFNWEKVVEKSVKQIGENIWWIWQKNLEVISFLNWSLKLLVYLQGQLVKIGTSCPKLFSRISANLILISGILIVRMKRNYQPPMDLILPPIGQAHDMFSRIFANTI